MTHARATNAARWQRESEARNGAIPDRAERRDGSEVPRYTERDVREMIDNAWLKLSNIVFGSYHHLGHFGGTVRADFQGYLDWLRSNRSAR